MIPFNLGPITDFLVARTPGCKEVTRLLSESMDHPLPWRTRMGIRLHYLICVWCERYGQHIRFLRDAVRRHPEKLEGQDAPPPASLSPEAHDRMKRALRNRRDAV